MSHGEDTVGPIRIVPHTPRCFGQAAGTIQSDGVTVVSVDTCGKLMGVLFDGGDSLYWYRAPVDGSDFGLPDELFT